MIDERALIARIDAAAPEEFARMLRNLSAEEERALRIHFGDESFREMRELATRAGVRRAAAPDRNVVVLHGIMGGELSENDNRIWLSIFEIFRGRFDHLNVSDQGASVRPVHASGILKKYYGKLLLWLAASWNTQAFWYDWRLDIRAAADQLASFIQERFPSGPVHLIAHSMGGLVSRSMIQRHGALWQRMAPGRLVMLGTPNHGSFAIPKLYSGLNDVVRVLSLVDVVHSLDDLLLIARNFSGALQMMPSLLKLDDVGKLYDPATYHCRPLLNRFNDAKDFHKEIAGVVDPQRMIYIAGFNHATEDGIADWNRLDKQEGYHLTPDGDGTVPHVLGLLDRVRTFYVDEEHSALPGNRNVLEALEQVLTQGTAPESLLYSQLPETRALRSQDALRQERAMQEEAALDEAADLAQRVQRTRGTADQILTPEAERLKDLLVRGFLATSRAAAAARVARVSRDTDEEPKRPAKVRLKVRVRKASIGDLKAYDADAQEHLPKVDMRAVGHYVGVDPQRAELALDEAVSGVRGGDGRGNEELILTEFTHRGTIRGDLGQIFLVPGTATGCDAAIAGMGTVGRFGIPELTLLSSELVWCAGRLGKKHLASVLIGSGDKNLSTWEAVNGWMQGVQRALLESAGRRPAIEALTFVELNENRVNEIRSALYLLQDKCGKSSLELEILDPKPEQMTAGVATEDTDREVRLIAELQNGIYRFGALTDEASFPERDFPLDPKLVAEANNTLAVELVPERQRELGEFMLKLLVPRDFQPALAGSGPIVLSCDTSVAQVHWEILSQPELYRPTANGGNFLGLTRGFTRQLRTKLAPAPEPPATPNRKLRVLVAADGASDAPLPGARDEGTAVAQLFRSAEASLRRRGIELEVVELIGPNEAQRARVLELLMRTPAFDVFHYAGHCYYDRSTPSSSGFVFSGKAILSSNELTRVDRVPRFVFSNACESGVTPSRSELRSPELAPSFAEAFFARGVSNFVCTAWPIDDEAARTFACTLYRRLLGLQDGGDAGAPERVAADGAAAQPVRVLAEPEAMHDAMMQARLAIKDLGDGAKTWGAYQHYGSPHFRLVRAVGAPR